MRYFGLDVGTAYLVSGSEKDENIFYEKIRDAFYVVDIKGSIGINPLEVAGINHIELDNKIAILGEDAIRFAAGQNSIARRPMREGVISDRDLEAEKILQHLLKAVCPKDAEKGAQVRYTIPADPLGSSDNPTMIHEELIGEILRSLGFKPAPINEAACIVLSELSDEQFTGLAISCGGGLINTTICNMGQPIKDFTFSVIGSGDKIDQLVANSLKGLGVHAASITLHKERMSKEGRGIYNPGGITTKDKRVEKGISSAYKAIIDHFTQSLEFQLNNSLAPEFGKPLPFIVAGGTSLIPGFCEYLSESLSKRSFPIEFQKPKLASDPLTCVAKGALIASRIAYIRNAKGD